MLDCRCDATGYTYVHSFEWPTQWQKSQTVFHLYDIVTILYYGDVAIMYAHVPYVRWHNGSVLLVSAGDTATPCVMNRSQNGTCYHKLSR